MHRAKGKSITRCIKDRADYAVNPAKTNNQELVSSYECDIRAVDTEFSLSKREYQQITGRTQQRDVIAYQIRQSFKPGEITAEEANRVGYELAIRFLKGKHAFFVATHIDRKHIHNHIIWNSTSLDCTYKFRDFLGSGRAVARLSDLICTEHQLSVVSNPKNRGQKYNKWLGEKATSSYREELRAAINAALSKNPIGFDELLQLLQDAGWEIKRGKDFSFRKTGMQRFIRLHTLGEGYSADSLIKRVPTSRSAKKREATTKQWRMSLLIDIQAKLQAGKGAGYERLAKVANLKQMAQALNYLSEHGLFEYDHLAQKADAALADYHAAAAELKKIEERLVAIGVLKMHVINYVKTRDVYIAYRKAGYSKRFAEEHEQEIQIHKAAKKHFDSLGTGSIPAVKSLQKEYAKLVDRKRTLYAKYRSARAEMKTVSTVKANIDIVLNIKGHPKEERGGSRQEER